MERFSDRGSIPLASTTRLSLDAIRVRVLLFVLVFLSRRGHLIAEIRSDGAEPAPISRRHDAAPDSRPGSFFILAFPSRRHDAAPSSRTHLLRVETERSRAGRLPLAALVCANRSFRQSCSSGGMMPHPIRERTSCGSRLNALAQVACLRLRQAEPAPNSRIGFVRGPTACLAVLGVCLLRGGRSAPPTCGISR